MEGLEQERRGVFGGVKPPFDLNAVILAFVAIVGFFGGVKVIEWLQGEPYIVERTIRSIDLPLLQINSEVVPQARWDRVKAEIDAENIRLQEESGEGARQIPLRSLQRMTYVLVGLWALILWAFFGGAIGRIMAMKIARDEGMEISAALKFGAQKFFSNLSAVLVVGIAITVLYLGCNSVIAGYLASIPYVGELLLILMYPFIFLSCLIIILLFVPLVLGHTLMSSAIATESSDNFDGMSRAFSYIYARPWQVILFYLLTIAYMLVFVVFGFLFFRVSVGSLRTGWLGLSAPKARIIEGFVKEDNSFSAVKIDRALYEATKDLGSIVDRDEAMAVHFAQTDPVDPFIAREQVPVTLRLTGTVVWFLIWLGKLFLYAYLVAYWFAANQAMYFILRRDVDGEDPSEIYIEEEREEEPFEITTPEKPEAEGAPPTAMRTEEAEPGSPPTAEKKKSTRKPASSRRSRSSGRQSGKQSGRRRSSRRTK